MESTGLPGITGAQLFGAATGPSSWTTWGGTPRRGSQRGCGWARLLWSRKSAARARCPDPVGGGHHTRCGPETVFSRAGPPGSATPAPAHQRQAPAQGGGGAAGGCGSPTRPGRARARTTAAAPTVGPGGYPDETLGGGRPAPGRRWWRQRPGPGVAARSLGIGVTSLLHQGGEPADGWRHPVGDGACSRFLPGSGSGR